jgi:hypothetical protein
MATSRTSQRRLALLYGGIGRVNELRFFLSEHCDAAPPLYHADTTLSTLIRDAVDDFRALKRYLVKLEINCADTAARINALLQPALSSAHIDQLKAARASTLKELDVLEGILRQGIPFTPFFFA